MMEQCQRIIRTAPAMNLEVQMAGGGVSSAPDGTDECTRCHAISCLDEVGAVVGIDRAESVRVGDLDDPPIGGLTPAEHHGARCSGADGRTARSLDVHAPVPAPEAAPTEARDDGALHGPEETRPVNTGRQLGARAAREAVRDSMGCRSIPLGLT